MARVNAADENWIYDPQVFRVNRIDAHSDHRYYEEKTTEYGEDMPLRQSLNGKWKYSYAEIPEKREKDFYKEDFNCDSFDDITVPGHIEMQGYDKCQYINTMYPWEGHEDIRPPFVPRKHNPVSSYVTYFDLNEVLKGKKTYISFQGVENAFYVWVNGQFVGYSEDTFTPSEFDITDFVKDKDNKLAVEVYKRSTASWLEDQDFWRFSGIFRDVYLYAVPKTHVQDIFVKAGLDADYVNGEFHAELKLVGNIVGTLAYELVDKSGKTVVSKSGLMLKDEMKLSAEIKDVLKWSAEVPDLYMFNVSVYDEDGNLVEYIPQRIGFRTFEMKNHVMCINGKRIIFKGVNRHEFSSKTGRCISKAELEKDIKIIKELNINAVRTSHYPNQTYWYELCDEFGIYLIDETNLETHGTWQCDFNGEEYIVPRNCPEWKGAVVDRAQSMLERDKNHPSVIIWSCGNESHAGEDILAMTKFFHERNPERLVHYEGCVHDRNYSDITDMESRMYAKPHEIAEYLDTNPDKPYISCEYTHAMGNSCGNMFKYTDLEYKYEQYQGGFIWDFVDQAIMKKLEDGTNEFMVGGDFGERPCDYYFCGNGIVFADRKLSPKAQEVKYLYQNIKLHPTDRGVLIMNENLFESTYDYIFEVRLLHDGKAVWAGSFSRDIPAGSEEFVEVDYPKMEEPGEYITECRAILMGYRKWTMPGHVSAWGQSKVFEVKAVQSDMANTSSSDVTASSEEKCFDEVIMGVSCIGVKTGNVHAIFSRGEGGLISYVSKGQELIERIPKLTFWRAATDNDKGSRFPVKSALWMGISQFTKASAVKITYEMKDGRMLDGTRGSCTQLTPKKGDALYGTGENAVVVAAQMAAVTIKYTFDLYCNPQTTATIEYRMTPDGKIKFTADYNGQKGLPQMPVFGVTFAMDKVFDRMEYYGRGPEENYNDRCKGARLGIFKSKVRDNVTPYLDPQECGNRHDVRWVKIVDEFNHGVKLGATGTPFDMTVLPYTAIELQEAYKINRLPKTYTTVVSILGAAMGVGGDDSWGSPVHSEFCVSGEENQHAEFTFVGI